LLTGLLFILTPLYAELKLLLFSQASNSIIRQETSTFFSLLLSLTLNSRLTLKDGLLTLLLFLRSSSPSAFVPLRLRCSSQDIRLRCLYSTDIKCKSNISCSLSIRRTP
jgi:hypothetical protein